jgi:hypothetical protein
MQGVLVASNTAKGIHAVRFTDGRLWIIVNLDPVAPGDAVEGKIEEVGSVELWNATQGRPLRAVATNAWASRATLWRDLLFDSVQDFESANPNAGLSKSGSSDGG